MTTDEVRQALARAVGMLLGLVAAAAFLVIVLSCVVLYGNLDLANRVGWEAILFVTWPITAILVAVHNCRNASAFAQSGALRPLAEYLLLSTAVVLFQPYRFIGFVKWLI